MDIPAHRREMLAHCMRFAEMGDPVHALWAASWYEENNPWYLHGLRARVERDIERMRVAQAVNREKSRQGGRQPGSHRAGTT